MPPLLQHDIPVDAFLYRVCLVSPISLHVNVSDSKVSSHQPLDKRIRPSFASAFGSLLLYLFRGGGAPKNCTKIHALHG